MESKSARESRLADGTIKALHSCDTTHKNKWSRSIRCLPFLLLALMVFVWGTGYKLSLYKALREDGSTPAKLRTRASDAAQSALLDATEDHGLITLLSLPIPFRMPAVASYVLCRRSLEDGQAMNPSPFHPPAALDLRPPPMRMLEL